LRFPGFEGEWERKKLGDIAKITKGVGIPKSQLSEHGLPCILYGELYTKYKSEIISEVFSLTNLNTKKLVKSKSNDVLIPSSGETAIDISTARYVPYDNILLGGDLNIIRLKNGNGLFFSYQLNGKRKLDIAKIAQGISVVHLYADKLKKLDIYYPKIAEQKKISTFISLIDERIQTQMKIIEGLEKLIKGLQEQIFSQKLRFKDENGNKFAGWEDYLLSEILIKNSERNKRLKYANIQSVSNKYGFINQEKLFEDRRIASKNTSNYYIIRKGVFAYNPSRIDVGSLAYKFDDNTSIISPLYISFWVDQAYIVDEFLLNWFMTQYFTIQINNLFEGSVRNTLSFESFGKVKINLPSIEEQKAIANFLSSINQRIDNERQLLTQYQNQKKFLLQNLFI